MGKDVKEHENRASDGRWLPGKTGNAAGRGMTNRQRISERLLADLQAVWEAHGKSVLERLALTDPGRLATIAYGLLPKDVFVKIEDSRAPGNLESVRELLDILEAAGVQSAEDLRARLATEIQVPVSNALAIEHDANAKANSDQ